MKTIQLSNGSTLTQQVEQLTNSDIMRLSKLAHDVVEYYMTAATMVFGVRRDVLDTMLFNDLDQVFKITMTVLEATVQRILPTQATERIGDFQITVDPTKM